MRSQALEPGRCPALIVVDASIGFTDPESPLGDDFSAELACINDLAGRAAESNWLRVFSTVSYRDTSQASVFRNKLPDLNQLAEGSRWVEIDPRLGTVSDAEILTKTAASCFFGTSLADDLMRAGVDTLYICGFTTSGCVRATAVDGLQHNFKTFVVTDATGDRDSAAHTANLRDLGLKYAELVTTAGVIASAF